MGKCIEKIHHDACGHNALQVFEDDRTPGKYNGFCFWCGTYVDNPYKDKPQGYKPQVIIKSPEDIQKEIEEVSEYLTVALHDRKLKKESLEHYGVKIGVSEEDGVTPYSHYYPYYIDDELIGYKVRLIENKRMWAIGSTKGSDFFGWKQAIVTGSKRLFVTEGELDAVALYQIMRDHNAGTQWAHLQPAVVSLSNGAGGASKQFANMLPKIRKHFKEVVLVFDNDEPGKKAVKDTLLVYPEALVATLPLKDANDCLIEGRSKAAYNACVFNADTPKNTRLVLGEEIHSSAKEAPKLGFSWPWKHITERTRGIRLGETIYIGAG